MYILQCIQFTMCTYPLWSMWDSLRLTVGVTVDLKIVCNLYSSLAQPIYLSVCLSTGYPYTIYYISVFESSRPRVLNSKVLEFRFRVELDLFPFQFPCKYTKRLNAQFKSFWQVYFEISTGGEICIYNIWSSRDGFEGFSKWSTLALAEQIYIFLLTSNKQFLNLTNNI